MDTLEGIQRLFEQAKNEPVEAFDVVESVLRRIHPWEACRPEPGPVWKVSAALSALAAVIPLVLVAEAFLVVDDFMVELFLSAQGVWPW